MDLDRIFIKEACPTKVGGQAVLEGIMMKGKRRSSVAVRLPDGRIHIKIEENKKENALSGIPFLRGIFVFVGSLVQGVRTLMYSADVLEAYGYADEEEENGESRLLGWIEKRFGEKGAWNFLLYTSVLFALVVSVVVFVIGPTAVTGFLKGVTENEIVLNLIEGCLRIALFILYVVLISRMRDIHRVFQFHGAEHKCIHCFENGLELTPENCQGFYTLHPRCGTSFLMFVMVIALVLFSLLGWPGLVLRITSRILLLPVIAGLSYELLRLAGRSDRSVVKILSMPGLALQKLTTAEPEEEHLQIAIAAMSSVLAEHGECGEGICDDQGHIVRPQTLEELKKQMEPGNHL